MKIIVAGASGLVGSALVPQLTAAGHEVVGLGRRAAPGIAAWDPAAGRLDPDILTGAGAVVNLAGAGIADSRWTVQRRDEIMQSRVRATRLLVDTLAARRERPAVFVSASGAGYYGNTGNLPCDEQAPAGEGFLADVCRRWEAEAEGASALGIRVVRLRLAMVLASQGGALAKMLPVFRVGLGGPAGDGRQWVSWIALGDVVGAIAHAIANDALVGAVNAAAPGAVPNAEFARVLGHVLGRPTALRAPVTALRLMFGRMAEDTVLSSSRIVPGRLLATGYSFQHAELEPALRHVLGS